LSEASLIEGEAYERKNERKTVVCLYKQDKKDLSGRNKTNC